MSDDFKKQTQLLSHNNSLVNFDNLLLSKKDSLVVVDFWATWCVPCLNQIAKLKLISDRLHNEKVAFIFVSVDEDINSWYSFHKKGLLNQENSYLLLNNFNSQLAKKFSLRTIPRTMVFKKGEVQFAEISINDLPKIVNRQYE
jgi:thiol-disulfide isomerase/thioredoxin